MSERTRDELIPSLDIFHEVINIDRDQVAEVYRTLLGGEAVRAVLSRAEWQEKRQRVRHLLKPARALRGEVVVPAEILRVQKYARVKGTVDEEHIDELSGYLDDVLPEFSRTRVIDTPTLPAEIKSLGRGGLVLGIAGSPELLQERAFVKAALMNFYQLESTPEGMWFNDEGVTSAWLARSSDLESNKLLRELAVTLDHKPELLPARTEFGGINILPDPPRE